MTPSAHSGAARPGLSRRSLLAGAAGATAMAGGLTACSATGGGAAAGAADDRVAFNGHRQAGISTPQQNRLVFATYDVTSGGSTRERRAALVDLLQRWTVAAAAMTAGRPVPGDQFNLAAPPADTGEAIGEPTARLTLTIGFGPSLFDDRFGLADRRPAALEPLPHLAPENLDPAKSDGDIAIQACADNAQVAFHAIRNLSRIGRDTVAARWIQTGFGRAASTSREQQTPRNLFGFKDGTRNIHGDRSTLDKWVWVDSDTDQPWMRGGSYLVARKIQMNIEAWDRDYLEDQQNVFGRHKYSGAPLGGDREFDRPDFHARRSDGSYVIPTGAHIRIAARENNNGMQILRRAFNYDDGLSPAGELDAGLFMIIFQKDPRTQFVALQRKLGAADRLNEYIQHVGSGLFACPPGVTRPDEFWGHTLFA